MAFLLFLVCLAAAACLLVPAFLLLCTRVQGSRGVEQRRLQGGKKLRLPPGSMGWPYVGETLQLYSQDPNVFFASKQKRYGEIFKTHLLGCPCVMLASPEAARRRGILKYLHDSPKLLEAVKAEQMAIYVANEGGKRPLTWTQTRSMTLTHQVILESLRMASIISFTFREAVADVEYKGFLIPKGWKVMPLFRNIHHNPDYFQDPQKFDPSRFKVAPRRPSTFLPFGSGVHACPGNELAKLEMLVLVHRLATAYRWEIVGGSDEVEYSPFPVPRRGLNAKLWKQEPEEEMAMDASGGVGVVTAASA
uniref:Uncharacterized protein n=1 Tax=Oryza brachyantha TaxID=4533 RepID=J3MTR8_ORYBR